MPGTTRNNCQREVFRWGQEYGHQIRDDELSEWDYHSGRSLTAKQRCDDWSYSAKSQYDLDRRLGRVFRWSHRPRTEATRQRLASEFKACADKWRNETRILSSIQSKIFNQNYQRIIGMGRPILPLIFADLKRRGGQWYWALECITGENPASAAATLDEAKALWLDYAVKNDYLPQ